MEKIKTNYIFLDESGKPEVYSAKGINLVKEGFASKFLVLAAVRCDDQLLLQQKITDFKASLLKNESLTEIFSPAYALDSFHAQTDYPEVKEKFYNFINTLDIKIDVIVVDKMKCFEPLQRSPGKMYGVMAGQLLKNICHQSEKTEVIFSRKDSKLKLRQELECKVEEIRLDYIAYAVFQVFENNNRKWYEIVKNKIGKIQDICNKKYFTQSNPL